MNDPLNGCQADPGAGKIGHGMQALEGPKEFIGIGHIETGAVIAHVKYLLSIFDLSSDLDLRLLQLGGEFPGIVNQVFQRDPQQA